MKTLEELKRMREDWLKKREDSEYYEEFKSYNFVAYSYENDAVCCRKSYADAKAYADQGGQVLVLKTEKIYTYKIKSDEEYNDYLSNEIKKENFSKMNYYGL